MTFEKSEIKYTLFALGFTLLWFLFLLPQLVTKLSGPLQFIVLNVGFVLVVSFVFKAISLGKSLGIKEVLGGLLILLAFSCWSIPLMVGFKGEFFSGPTAYAGAVDYNIALLWQAIGVSGTFLYLLTYVLSPIILLFVGSYLLKDAIRRI
jgi:hypothetical protein